jgi:O-antigen/teichoic acid export membrane protein
MNDSSEEKYYEITEKATRGAGWNYLIFGSTKFLTLITLAILARLLPPEDFGLVALATLTMDYLSVISDLGFGAAVIQRKGNIKEAANIAFTINLLANIALTVVIFLAAPLAASFFREPQVTLILRWLSLTFMFKAAGSIHNVLLERDLNFKRKIVPELGSSIFRAAISISLALSGFGVWALVVGQLAGVAATSLLLWYLVPWKPNFSWHAGTARELFSFGFSIMGINALSAWEDNFDYLIIGRIFNTTALGVYTIAYRLPETLIMNTMWVLTAVLFPAFSALQDDKDSLKRGLLTIIRYVQLLITPLCLGMVIAADPLIRVAFGEQWVGAIPILRVISLYTLVTSISFHAGDVYKAIGRPDILLKLAIPIVPLRLVALWIGAQYSILGVAYAHLGVEVISTAVNLIILRRMINVTFFEIVRELKAFVGGAVLIACALPALHLTQDYAPILRLIIVTIAGGIGYMGTIWIVERRSLMAVLRMLGGTHFNDKEDEAVQ